MSVTANNKDIAGEGTGHQVVYMAPSVCITPAAPSPIPLPYPIMTATGTGTCNDDSRKTKIQGKTVFCVGSTIASCNGNEPGTQKETVSFKTGSKMFPLDGSSNVEVEGSPVCFTGTQGMGNAM